MKYDFDSVINRRDTDSMKWDVEVNELPMWVADMDYITAPEILDALKERLDHGILGYPVIPGRWYDAYINWWKDRHDLAMKRESLVFCSGVIPAVSAMIRAFSLPGSNVLIEPPVYNCFFNIIKGNGRKVQESPLIYKNGAYERDFEELEKQMSDPETELMILCNPQNPTGNIWKKEELAKIGELAEKHGVKIISDEIHCDLTEPGMGYVPFAAASPVCADIGISFIAPTKAFNLAGLKTAAVYVCNEETREKVKKALDTDELSEPNAFASTAAIAAFEKGGPWLDGLREYISENRKTVYDFLHDELPQIHAVKGFATYLMWLDISGLKKDTDKFAAFLRKQTGLFLSPGVIFGQQGMDFLRMNIACPKSVLMDGLSRLKAGADEWMKKGEK
ncbi:MAG: pyridoxal phosphate-dependent aminotransferase [Lachnospiraceae bacterium]|nr:pyridoxal phosphate-dependent aminotransferase [Lachnospiraceae bacterium]